MIILEPDGQRSWGMARGESTGSLRVAGAGGRLLFLTNTILLLLLLPLLPPPLPLSCPLPLLLAWGTLALCGMSVNIRFPFGSVS